jgi:hypothetical protein
MVLQNQIDLSRAEIANFCQRHAILKLSLFGSVLRDDFRPGSDVDVLVEFEEGKAPGLFRLAGMELELSELLDGRKVDLNTPRCLSPYIRDRVLKQAVAHYTTNLQNLVAMSR